MTIEKTTRIITAPIEGTLNVVNSALEPISDAAQELVDDTEDL